MHSRPMAASKSTIHPSNSKMRLLLDTNIFFFLATDPDRLLPEVYDILRDYDNQLYVSVETVKELIVAYRNKGIGIKKWKNEVEMIKSIEQDYQIKILPLKEEHMLTYAKLSLNETQGHKDPSDHVIISHAITERLTLISSDTRFPFYRGQKLDLIENRHT